MSWRDLGAASCGREHVGQRLDARRLGGARAATTAGSSSSTSATATGLGQLVINPERAPEAATAAHEIRNEFVLRAEGEVVAARARGRQPEPADRRGRAAGRRSSRSSRAARRSRSSSTRRTSTRRCASATAGSTCAAPQHAAQHPRCARRWSRSSGATMEGAGFVDIETPILVQADAGGRARLRRPDAAPAGPLLRAAAVAADPQAAARDLRLRALLPDRALLPGRGSARRPPPGAHAARRRDGLPGRASSSGA